MPNYAALPAYRDVMPRMPRREALTRTEKDTMKLKLDENGHVVVKDGFPVWVAEDGAEIAYNVPDLVNKISAINAESADGARTSTP